MTSTTIRYFAYGSNMLTRRLVERTPSARVLATGYVEGRRLTFHKVSKDGSGKCDAEQTTNTSDRVYGVIFEIDPSERKALDRAEGLNNGYNEAQVDVVTPSGTVPAITYVATHKEPAMKPYRWYKSLTVAGAIEHELPLAYVEWIRAVESMEDPDVERRKNNEALLFAS